MKKTGTEKERILSRSVSWKSTWSNIWASTRPRNVSEYLIQPDEPYKIYSPGDRVKGLVILNIERPTRITHLTICLHGVVQILKNGRTPGDSNQRWREYLSTGPSRCGEAYFGNGLAALFKDEVVLAGDGYLNVGSYRFQYDLELPSHGLPSSIEFQHGHISYFLSAILTRPVTISATSRCDHKLAVKESIDVVLRPVPPPKTIPIETTQKRPGRPKSTVGNKKSTTLDVRQSFRQDGAGHPRSVSFETSDSSPQSPTSSDISCVSTVSSGNQGLEAGSGPVSSRNSYPGINDKSNEFPFSSYAIIEVLTGGCLPGDSLPIRLSVNLPKAVKSPQGIIVTLYRECHFNLHPEVVIWQQGRRQEHEDCYPKSRTGLSGLSLSSGGSSRVFRQDINQTFTPLILDPRTFAANLKTSIQVPEGVFPTISSVPGAMLHFKYYVEIVIDLRGRSAGQERFFPRFSMVNAAPSFDTGDPKLNPIEAYDGIKLPFTTSFCFLDTSQIRREKGVVTHKSEVTVGTRDSGRNRMKQMDMNLISDSAVSGRSKTSGRWVGEVTEADFDDAHRMDSKNAVGVSNQRREPSTDAPSNPGTAPTESIYIAPPPESEEVGDEKSRLRCAEELLLPSAPPGNDEPSSSLVSQLSSSGLDENAHFDEHFDQSGASAPAYEGPSAPSLETIVPHHVPYDIPGSSHQPYSVSANSHLEDKQELERRRLQAQASSPNEDSAAGNIEQFTEPSAPTLHQHGSEPSTVQSVSIHAHTEDGLPQYQR